MDEPISLAQTYDVLTKERMKPLVRTIADVVNEWRDELWRPGHDGTVRARSISSRFYFLMTERLAADPGISHGTSNGQPLITFDERIQGRVKHLDSGLASRNYPTEQAQDWVKTSPLEGFLIDRIHFGYRLDVTERMLKDAFVARPTGDPVNFNAWVWQVWGSPIDLRTYGKQLPFGAKGVSISDIYLYEDYSQII